MLCQVNEDPQDVLVSVNAVTRSRAKDESLKTPSLNVTETVLIHPDITRRESVESFARLQAGDTSLDTVRGKINDGHPKFFINVQNIIFHRDVLCGIEIHQLVTPHSKRSEIVQIAHDVDMSGHFGSEKILSRIRASFYWPGMKLFTLVL